MQTLKNELGTENVRFQKPRLLHQSHVDKTRKKTFTQLYG